MRLFACAVQDRVQYSISRYPLQHVFAIALYSLFTNFSTFVLENFNLASSVYTI